MEKIGNFTHSALASLLAAHIKRERKRDPFIEREMDAMDDFRALFMPRQRQLPDVKREERVPCNGRGAKPRIILMYEDLKGGRHCTVLERKLLERFCKLSSDISTGNGAILQLPCCPKQKRGTFKKQVTKPLSRRPRLYRVSHHVSDLGWFDLDLGSSPGWWAAIVASYCPSRVAEHPKTKSPQPRSETWWDTL